MLGPENTAETLNELDRELVARGEERTLIACGGGALLAMQIIERQTRDLDVIVPKIDPVLGAAAEAVARKLGLSTNWLNNGPESLTRDLLPGWEERSVPIFKGKALEVRALGRSDLIATKMYAFCDREDDFEDLLRIKPTREELEAIRTWVLERDGSHLWPGRVAECFARLGKALGHEERK